jgi:cystathionine beta-lyase
MAAHGVYGYFGDDRPYLPAIRWWMRGAARLGGRPEATTATHACQRRGPAVQAWTRPGDAVILFTPVYHAFARVIRASGRTVTNARCGSRAASMSWISPPTTPSSRDASA